MRLLPSNKIQSWAVLLMGLMAALSFRIYFGLHAYPLIFVEDEIQIYLIGLKSYVTHTWPTYGTDLIMDDGAPRGQMAGALQGLLIAIPLFLWPSPVSPFLFLGVLSLLSLTFLGWYCCGRLPGFPSWFVLLWLYFAPWSTHISTTALNQSYASIGAVLFCVGFMESVPSLRVGILSKFWANAMMSFGLLWMAQLHMTWVMFIPLAAYSLWAQWRKGFLGEAFLGAGLGSLPMLGLMVPTYLAYGFSMARDAKGYSSLFNADNLLAFFTILARFLSFASFEMPHFIGPGTHERVGYLLREPWLTVPGFFLWIVGLVQPFAMLFLWFLKNHPRPDWKGVKNMILALLAVLYVLFLFSAKDPNSFRYPEVLPFVMIYSFYCWDYLSAWKFWRVFGVVFIAASVYFQVGYALKSAGDKVSFYDRYRDRVEQAIEAKDYHLLGERRPNSLY